ncbi:hypothetical protein [Candidatus Oscillochloris fontis]|uniref:hypothetical protein n=1 Tax=Candidatus Oscillochloris fontis TaxID=2496868 RepID=UPI00101DB3D0|nr:hypothetical protein [Candidatus Oscillochloris fontis]
MSEVMITYRPTLSSVSLEDLERLWGPTMLSSSFDTLRERGVDYDCPLPPPPPPPAKMEEVQRPPCA